VRKLSEKKAISKMIWAAIVVIIVIIAGVAAYWWYIIQPTTTPPAKVISIAWTEGPEFDFINGKIDEFTNLTGITVNFLKIPRAHIVERLMLEMLSSTPSIDGSVVYVLEAPTLASTGGLVDLYTYRSKSDWVAESFYQNQLETLEFNGSLYYVPSIWNGALVNFYRTDLFSNAALQQAFNSEFGYALAVPNTPEKLLDVAKFFTEQGYIGIHLQMTTSEMGAGAYTFYPPLAAYFGGGIYNATTSQIVCNSTGSVTALEYLLNLSQYAQPTLFEDGTFEAETAVMQGVSGGKQLAMADQWSYMYNMLPQATYSWNISERIFPQQPDMLGIAILKNSPKKDYVWQFVNWTSSFEICKGTTLATPKAPCRSDVANDPEVKANYWLNIIVDSYGGHKALVPVIKNPHATEIYESMMLRLNDAFNDPEAHTNPHAAAQRALDNLYSDIQSILVG
jgi:ABC-type glycerol-3-phosphate transport system substrate-binding protein